MANTIRIKRRAAGGAAGAPASLKNAELAFNEQDNSLYYGFGDAGGGTASSIIPIAGKGAFMDLSTTQTVAGAKTFSSTITGSVSGNAGTATTLQTSRSITATGDLSWTVNFDGSAPVSAAATLATVNSNVGTYTKLTVNAKGLVTAAATASHSDLSAPTADVAWGSFKITGLADPASAQDAATKAYVDSVAQGLDVKYSVKAATTANITLSGAQTIDGVSIVATDRVLVKNQSTPSGNGIYVAAAGAWTRATDMDAWAEVPGAFVFIEQGTTQSDTGWVCTSDAGGTLGTTAINWTQFSGAGSYVAGNGLTLTGQTFDVVGTSNRISVAADSIDIAATYVGQTSITTLGTIATGVWNGTGITVGYGGTGLSTITTNGIMYGNATSAVGVTAAGTYDATNSVGQLLSVNSSGVPTWTNTIDGGTF